MTIPFYHIDTFTSKVFAGNPAGVCLLETWLPESLLQQMAAEHYLPVTVFAVQTAEAVEIRWFSPLKEIFLCGHGTLAVAHVMFQRQPAEVVLKFKSTAGDVIMASRTDDGRVMIHLPAIPARECETFPGALITGLGDIPRQIWQATTGTYLAIFDTEAEVRQLVPNFDILRRIDPANVIVTAPGDTADFVSRYFLPQERYKEDAVTGSAHCILTPYWAKRFRNHKLYARQLSARGGEIWCENAGKRVKLSGYARLYAERVINRF
ncbi:MAG: PhzF family phenazine biosynthesis protein [Gemmatimonadetes bacterium]|nr:MAG: PhzF family phenazine biosynthesis protein [Gemmatimonadota bacterium]